jgi:ankyrin repeat protein
MGACLLVGSVTIADPPDGEIHVALAPGKQDIPKAKALLMADPKLVHAKGYLEQTPLHIVARYGPIEMVEHLLNLKADVNSVAYNGFTPMHLVEEGKIAALLIRSGAKLDQLDNWGKTPLQNAADYDRKEVIEAILASGYKLDLTTAVKLKKRDVAIRMVKEDPGLLKRIKPGGSLWGGDTPLAIAAGQGDVALVKLFLDSGADVNEGTTMPNAGFSSATALTNAVWAGHTEVVRLLMMRGAHTDVTGGKRYRTILEYARKHASPEIVSLLEKSQKSKE